MNRDIRKGHEVSWTDRLPPSPTFIWAFEVRDEHGRNGYFIYWVKHPAVEYALRRSRH